MAIINCSECESEVSDKAPTCPQCGAPINESDANTVKTIGMVLAILIPPIGFVMGLFMLAGQHTRKHAPRTLIAAIVCVLLWPTIYTTVQVVSAKTDQKHEHQQACRNNIRSIHERLKPRIASLKYINFDNLSSSEKRSIIDRSTAIHERCPSGGRYKLETLEGENGETTLHVSCSLHSH